jgi:FKBP-type peptidyl-prolyl cis-trans isomerase
MVETSKEKPIGESKAYLVWTAVAFVAIFVMAYLMGGKGNNTDKNVGPTPSVSAIINNPKEDKKVESLVIEDIKVGTGAEAVSGKTLTVDYKGTLTNGTKFDSSYDRGQPFSFTLGEGRVIKGWEQGLVGMKVGGKRKLTIPSTLGYGERGAGASIPPNATLVFEVELLKVE